MCTATLTRLREQARAFTSQGGRRATTKIKDIEGVTKNCFACLPLAVYLSVMCLTYVDGVSLSVISVISLVLLKWKHGISVLVCCRRVSATCLKCCLQKKETSQISAPFGNSLGILGQINLLFY